MRFKKFKYETVGSTNSKAIKLIREKKQKEGFIFAGTQTHGRGTRGKKKIRGTQQIFTDQTAFW